MSDARARPEPGAPLLVMARAALARDRPAAHAALGRDDDDRRGTCVEGARGRRGYDDEFRGAHDQCGVWYTLESIGGDPARRHGVPALMAAGRRGPAAGDRTP